jgi:uncharacterized protein
MSQRYLIDGYNLLYALGLPPGPLGPRGLEKARGRLLAMLAGALGDGANAVTVTFDARQARSGSRSEEEYHGVRVLFAVHHEEADELIEELIRRDPTPRQLAVVSDDHRVQRAARHRRCQVLGCQDFLDLLEKLDKPQRPATAETELRGFQSEEEKQRWIKEFGDLDKDPAMRELFGWLDFDEK